MVVAGCFGYYSVDNDPLNRNESRVTGDIIGLACATAGLLIPLKMILSFCVVASPLNESHTRKQIESQERRQCWIRAVGVTLTVLWIAACIVGIGLLASQLPEHRMNKWIVIFAGAFFLEVVIFPLLKILLVRLLFGMLLLKLSRSACLTRSSCSCFAGFINCLVLCI